MYMQFLLFCFFVNIIFFSPPKKEMYLSKDFVKSILRFNLVKMIIITAYIISISYFSKYIISQSIYLDIHSNICTFFPFLHNQFCSLNAHTSIKKKLWAKCTYFFATYYFNDLTILDFQILRDLLCCFGK